MIPAAVFAAILAVGLATGGSDDVRRNPETPRSDSAFRVWPVDLRRDSDQRHGTLGQPSPYVLRIPFLATDGTAEPYASEPVAQPELTPEPSPVKDDAPVASPEPADAPEGFWGEVTHYGESFNGLAMGCDGAGRYYSWDVGVAAVPWPSRDSEWPCGTRFVVSGPTGSIHVVRTDSCPGCGSNHLDLSEAGMLAVCGYLGRCPVWIEVNP